MTLLLYRKTKELRPFLFLFITILLGFFPGKAGAYEVPLVRGSRLNIPETWVLTGEDKSRPCWFSPDSRGAVEAMFWEPGTWTDMQTFADDVRPENAQGQIIAFPCWGGKAALADWTFTLSGETFRGWFLLVLDAGVNIRLSAFAADEDFSEMQPFLLSVLDSYSPGPRETLSPGAVSRFMEFSSPEYGKTGQIINSSFQGQNISWNNSLAAAEASQKLIEREAAVLSAYAGIPEIFYPAWKRYYRMVYRDTYSRLAPLAEALNNGPLPQASAEPEQAAKEILSWLQGFSYGSIESVSGLLSPVTACSSATGDCDSLVLALLVLLDRYNVPGLMLLSHQAHHAIAALQIPGKGFRYVDEEGSWLAAELTTALPPGSLPERLNGVSDWFAVNFSYE
ncbi:MAG: hypothetical protein CSA76_01760 [Spirochaetales bacterium]|nr:MAG: hypothetical protein CSA76_01760 [Spirochaetales bacterium]